MENIDIDKENLPKHIAIIMDGNRRWAKDRELTTRDGHKEGAQTLEDISKFCNKIGIKYLTVYAFSTENWKRSKKEVSALMAILRMRVDAFIKEKVSVDKVVSSECKALIRFKKPQKDKIIQIIKDKFKEAEVIAQDDELAVVVDAPSECAINDSIKFIEDNNYCEDASKILKLS